MGERAPPEFVKGQGPATLAPAEAELVLSDLVCQFDSGEDDAGVHERLEAEHAGDPALDGAMILLDDIIEVLAAADSDLHPCGIFAP